jgi:AcrR family transcriptional regulator
MARPRSEEKQLALLEAATQVIASQGLGAPTSAIAKRAGVAEGTLFRYFPTKDDLLNDLFAHIVGNLAQVLQASEEPQRSAKERLCILWNAYFDWGYANPDAHSAMNQLALSEKIRPEIYEAASHLCADFNCFIDHHSHAGLNASASSEFAEATLAAIGDVALNFARRKAEDAHAYRAAGFEFLWRALHRD